MKKLTGIFLAVCMLLSLSALPAAAHQDFSDGTDFETFTTTYNKDDPDTYNGWGQHIYETPNSYMTQREAQNAGNGAYAAGPAGSKYGKALKIYQGHVDGSGVYGGVTYWFNEKLYDTFYFEGSFYAENAIPRVLRLYGDKGSTPISSLYFTKSNTIELFGNDTGGKRYELNKWYDVKMWYNMNEKIYRVIITCDGELVLNQTGEDKNSVQLEYINKIEFFNSINCKNLTEDSYCYWDNVKAETSFSYSPKRGIADDFEDYVSDEPSTLPRNPGNTIFNYSLNYQQQGTDGVVSDNTAGKGTSAKLMAEKQTYPTLGADMKTPIPAMDARFSVKVPELNGNSRVIYLSLVKTDEVTSAPQLTAMQFSTNGTIDVGGKSYPYEINKWYDVRITYVSETKTEEYWVWDDSGSLIAHDTYTHDKTIVSNVKRLMFRMTNNPKALERCHYWIDDLKIIEPARENAESFKVNYAESTTGPEINVKKDDDVIIKFNNKLAAAETPEALKGKLALNFGKGKINSVERVDDYTVSVDFNKMKDKHYHVSFTDIEDVYGNKLSDYIEFDTEPENANGRIFVINEDGTETNYIKPGTINIKAEFYSPSGIVSEGIFSAALYDSEGKIQDIFVRKIKYTETKEEENFAFSVPDDEKAYKIKAMLWKDTAEPVAKAEKASRIAIIKLDDLRDTNYDKFLLLKNWAEENRVKMGFGIVCNSLEKENDAYYKAVKAMDDSEYVEIWCHGYTHAEEVNGGVYSSEFNAPLAEQIETLQKCADILYEKCGVTVRSLGAPHNRVNDDTARAMEAVPQYKTVIESCNDGVVISGSTFKHLSNRLLVEKGTGIILPYEDIMSRYKMLSDKEYFIIPGHAPYWDGDNRKDFETVAMFIEFLKGEKVRFMTPTEYYNFIK